MPRTNKSSASKAGDASAARQTAKQRLQTEAAGLGLATTGTAAQLQDRINAMEESCADTAEALTAPAQQPKTSKPKAGRLPVHPTNAALIGGAIGAAWHCLG